MPAGTGSGSTFNRISDDPIRFDSGNRSRKKEGVSSLPFFFYTEPMAQFLVRKELINDGFARLEGEEAHHARKAHRLKAGDTIRIFDGEGTGYEGLIADAGKNGLRVKILSRVPEAPRPILSVVLAQSLLPGEAMDDVIQRATELGADEIVPVSGGRSIVKLSASRRHAKIEHWEKVALAGCKQSHRLRLPRIHPVTRLEDLLSRLGDHDLVLVPDTAHSGETLRHCLSVVFNVRKALVLIGPEGGFEAAEVASFKQRGARLVSLGAEVLRSGTAALHVLSVLKYLYEPNGVDSVKKRR